jgi:hypothetical protein
MRITDVNYSSFQCVVMSLEWRGVRGLAVPLYGMNCPCVTVFIIPGTVFLSLGSYQDFGLQAVTYVLVSSSVGEIWGSWSDVAEDSVWRDVAPSLPVDMTQHPWISISSGMLRSDLPVKTMHHPRYLKVSEIPRKDSKSSLRFGSHGFLICPCLLQFSSSFPASVQWTDM